MKTTHWIVQSPAAAVQEQYVGHSNPKDPAHKRKLVVGKKAERFSSERAAQHLCEAMQDHFRVYDRPFKAIPIEEPHARTIFTHQGFHVMATTPNSELWPMGSVIDGMKMDNEFSRQLMGSAYSESDKAEHFYMNRIFVPAPIRGFGLAGLMMAELCRNQDMMNNPMAIVAELAPYDSSVNYQRLLKLFKDYGFVVSNDHFMVRSNQR